MCAQTRRPDTFRLTRPDWRRFLLPVALVLAVATAYGPALQAGFIWDDDDYVTENITLRDFSGLGRIWLEPTATPQYYPLVHTTFWTEYQLWGLWPAGYHFDNVALHATAALLVWHVLSRLQVPAAGWAAAVFALHPVEVESVAWVTERKNVLSAVFYFGSLAVYLPLLDGGPDRPRRRYALATILYVAALLSKTVSCSLPVTVLLLAWYRHGRVAARDIGRMAPWLVLGLAAGLTTAYLERHHVGASGDAFTLTLAQRCQIAGMAVWFYWGKLLMPIHLAFMYPRWNPATFGLVDGWYPAMVIAAVIALWLCRSRWGRGPLTAVLYFLVTAFPALGFISVYPMRYSFVADHFQYLASLGPIALGVVLLARLPLRNPRIGRGLGLFGLLVMAGLTAQQCRIYDDVETLWTDTLKKAPDSFAGHFHLGKVRRAQGRHAEATTHFRRAIVCQADGSEDDIVRTLLANSLASEGLTDEAVAEYEAALARNPQNFEALNGLGTAQARRGRLPWAQELFERALVVRPDSPAVRHNLGNVFASQGRLDDAIGEYRKALQQQPEFAICRLNLANAYARQRRLDLAEQSVREVLRQDPGSVPARKMLDALRADVIRGDRER